MKSAVRALYVITWLPVMYVVSVMLTWWQKHACDQSVIHSSVLLDRAPHSCIILSIVIRCCQRPQMDFPHSYVEVIDFGRLIKAHDRRHVTSGGHLGCMPVRYRLRFLDVSTEASMPLRKDWSIATLYPVGLDNNVGGCLCRPNGDCLTGTVWGCPGMQCHSCMLKYQAVKCKSICL